MRRADLLIQARPTCHKRRPEPTLMTASIHTMNPRGVPPGIATGRGFPRCLPYSKPKTFRPWPTGCTVAASVLSDDSPSLAADLRTASRLLRALLNKIDAVAAKANETAALLANLHVAVED
jgi:hypothetical protein